MELKDVILQIASLIGGLGVIVGFLVKVLHKVVKPIVEIDKTMTTMQNLLMINNQATGMLLRAEIKKAYEKIMEKGSCTLIEKRSFLILCMNYRKMGYNHIRASLEEEIIKMPTNFDAEEPLIDGMLTEKETAEFECLEKMIIEDGEKEKANKEKK